MGKKAVYAAEEQADRETRGSNVGPWCAGDAECLTCGAEWIAVWPLGAEAIECPECGGFDTDRTARPAESGTPFPLLF